MKKILNLFSAFVLSAASFFLPIVHSLPAFAAVGDSINTTATIDAASLAYMDDSHFSFDDQNIESGVAFSYTSTGGSHTIKFNLAFEKGSLLGNSVTAVTVNNVAVDFNDLGQDEYSFSVDELTSYAIGFTVEQTGVESHTIIWGNPGSDIQEADAKIYNGRAKVIAVYDHDGHLVDQSTYTHPGTDGGVDNTGSGWVQIIDGYRVVFEFTPDYGHQLTSVAINETPLEPQDTINQYSFIMPSTNAHFSATFSAVDDVVDAESDKVESGVIELGDDEFEAGTARLSVSDADPDTDKISDFNAAANGRKVINFLDIDLYNIFYKGSDDGEDVWSNQIHHLDNEAIITLQLSDDVDVSNVVLIHNIDDGDEFEIIEILSYDVDAHTITFKTSSFSGYAIASKIGSPNTGVATKNYSGVVVATNLITGMSVTILVAVAWLIVKR